MRKILAVGILLTMAMLVASTMAIAPAKRSESFGDPIGNYNFRVEIDGVDAGHFSSVDGLSIEQEVIEYQNVDDPLTRKRPGRVKYGDITLKRALTEDSAFLDWITASQRGEKQTKSCSLTIEDKKGDEVRRYNFFECFPTSWKMGSLDGKGNDVLTEEVVIVIEQFEES